MQPREQLAQFKFDRSKNAADAANQNSRLMAQATVLINGAAATALFALLSKDKLDPHFLKAIPVGLWWYAVGAAVGWIGMFIMTECLDLFNKHWEEAATHSVSWWTTSKAHASWWTYRVCYLFSAFCFVWASYKLYSALSVYELVLPSCIAD